MNTIMPFFNAFYSQPLGLYMEFARFSVFTTKKIIPKVIALSPISDNLLQHILMVHLRHVVESNVLQMSKEISQHFGWESLRLNFYTGHWLHPSYLM